MMVIDEQDKRIRDAAFEDIIAFLTRKEDEHVIALSKTEMSKLWKGLFYCIIMVGL
jgi:hypothetical protein